jgi:hypothetical protein
MLFSMIAIAAAVSGGSDYGDTANWLCLPGRSDACVADTRRTVVDARGTTRVEPVRADPAPKADCFYVYPTASAEPTANSDLIPGKEERGQAASQFAVFSSVCRTFAPMYRQVTLAALRAVIAPATGAAPGKGLSQIKADREIGYADVRAAWRYYLQHDNNGRPFVLIGHSQGSAVLKRLLAQEIDGQPIARQMLSAIIPGTTVLVPKGKDLGADFKTLPLCRADRQTGCIVTWASYRDTLPPPANALFGRSVDPANEAGCTNPAGLGGGPVPLDSVVGFPWWSGGFVQYKQPASGWSVAGKPLLTRYARVPGMLAGQCVTAAGVSYLSVHVEPAAFGGLTKAVTSPAVVGDTAYPDWGWHVMDIPIVQGDLVRLVQHQIAAWQSRQ